MTVKRLRRLLVLLAVVGTGYWLFADTVRRHCVEEQHQGRIRFSYWGGIDDHRMWQSIIAAFEREHPQLDVIPEWLPLSGYATKIDQQLVAGEAPDVIMFQDEPFPRYSAEQFADLSPFLADDQMMRERLSDCWASATASFKRDGQLRGIPISGGTVLVYCNIRAFERAGRYHDEAMPLPPADWTMDDFVLHCKRLTIDEDGDGRTDQYGFLQPHWVYYLPFIWSHGASLLDESRTKWALEGPEAESALAFYADLRHRWGVSPMPMEYAGQNSDTAFLSGRVAMCVNGPWFQAFLRETSLADQYAVRPIPRGPAGSSTRVTWDALCIYGKMPEARQRQAWEFVRYVLDEGPQSTFARHLRAVPARRACADVYIHAGGGEGSPAAAFVASLDDARLQPISEDWHILNRVMWRYVTALLREGESRRSPAEVLADMSADRDVGRCFGEVR